MKDHRTDIVKAAQSLTADLVAALRRWEEDEEADHPCDDYLEIEMFSPVDFSSMGNVRRASPGERYICEITITLGGPTVRIHIDQYRRVTLRHSWGKDFNGEPQDRLELTDDLSNPWLDLADSLIDVYA